MSTAMTCPCGTGRTFDICCGPYLSGMQFAPTAEQLMRARYSAYATGHVIYLMNSWHPRTRPLMLELEVGQVWTGLQIHSAAGGGLLDSVGTVDFTARYQIQKVVGEVREHSTFERFDGKWYYVDQLDPSN